MLFAGTVHDYQLVTESNPCTTMNDSDQAAQGVHEPVSLTPPPRPPPPRVSPLRRGEHHSLVPPALPPKERLGAASLTLAEIAGKLPVRTSSCRLVPPPLPEPRQKRKETSPIGCSRSAVADHLASKVAPALPVDSDDSAHAVDSVSISPAIPVSVNVTLPQNGRHAVPNPLRLGLDAPKVGLKGKTIPRASSDCCWPRDAATSSTNGSLKARVDNPSAAECSVCLEQPIDCVLYTCGHMCMCYECAVGLHRASTAGGSCPICRQTIRDVIKIYRS